MRISALLIVVGMLTASVMGGEPSPTQTADIYRAVVEHFLKDLPPKGHLACVGLGDGAPAVNATDPPADLLRRLAPRDGSVEPASVCKDDDEHGFRVRGQRRSGGVILTLGKIRLSASGRAEVPVTSCC